MPSLRSDSNGVHALRNFYASVLLDAGESVRAVADYLGHADPGFTLRVYTHLMPTSEDRTKCAVDAVMSGAREPQPVLSRPAERQRAVSEWIADGPETAQRGVYPL